MSQTLFMDESNPPTQEAENSIRNAAEDILKKLEALATSEEKLAASIGIMRDALAQEGIPNFKDFWEVRKICLPLFKETLVPATRTTLWAEYTELTREGRRLKSLLDEETAYSVEQIDLAISALEDEVKGYHTHLEEILEKSSHIELPPSEMLKEKFDFYQRMQQQLNLLNFYASRVNALRKELINTEMRIRHKNKFFQRLSQLGDQIFPSRKDLIRNISEAFTQDVSLFVHDYFSEENFDEVSVRRLVFLLRGEIKSLQTIAKILTLNTHAFSSTREMLSCCWDKLKGMEKELKKEHTEHKQISFENALQVKERIEKFQTTSSEQPVSFEEGLKELEDISRWMREIQLTRHDVNMLKDLLREAREPLELKRELQFKQRQEKEAEFEKVRNEKIESFKKRVEVLQATINTGETEALNHELEDVRKTLNTLPISKGEKLHLDRTLKNIRDLISDRQSQVLLSLSEDERAAFEDLESLLDQRVKRRKEIKGQIEEYRKIIGGSGLDFEKAMRYNELIETEKESLAKIDENISEIKKKIHELYK